MAKDFKIEGAALVIEEGGAVIFENPKRDVYFDNSELVDNARVVLYDTNGTNKNASSIFSADLSECTDNGTPFTEETLRTFSRESLGFNQGGGSPSTESVVDTWVYKNTSYTNNSNGLFIPQNFINDLVIGNNVDLVTKTSESDLHDGTSFKFSEDDVIQFSANMQFNANSNMNIIQASIRTVTTNFIIQSEDISIAKTGQGLFLNFTFPAHKITSTQAQNGVSLVISDYQSSANSKIYNIKITAKKLGTNK